jgi:hypothetical protein
MARDLDLNLILNLAAERQFSSSAANRDRIGRLLQEAMAS